MRFDDAYGKLFPTDPNVDLVNDRGPTAIMAALTIGGIGPAVAHPHTMIDLQFRSRVLNYISTCDKNI